MWAGNMQRVMKSESEWEALLQEGTRRSILLEMAWAELEG